MGLSIFVVGAFLLSALVGWLTIPRIVLISKKKKLFDVLSERKSHTGAIPRLGGVAFLPAFLFSFSLTVGMRYYYGLDISPLFETMVIKELMFLLTGTTVLFFVGLADDLSGISYKTKFVAQIAAAILMIYAGVGITNLGGLFGVYAISPIAGSVLTVLLIVLLVNAYNLIDGIDGLCSGLSMLALFAYGIWFWTHHIYIYAMMAMAMAGVVSVFFYYNVMGSRLKIFMGDIGSLMLGFMISFLGLKFYSLTVDSAFPNMQAAPVVCLGIVFIPAFDTIRVFFVRMRMGLSPFHPDRRHIHHKVLSLGLSHLQSTLIIVLVQAGFIGINFLLKDININLLLAIDIVLATGLTLLFNRMGDQHEKRTPKSKKNKTKR